MPVHVHRSREARRAPAGALAIALILGGPPALHAGETPRRDGVDMAVQDVAIAVPRSLAFFPLLAARELGYLDEAGVSTTFLHLEGEASLQALEAGRVDLVAGSADGPFGAPRRGPRLQHVMALQDRTPAVFVARLGAVAPGNVTALRGRRLAVPRRPGTLELALREILRAAGVEPARDTRIEGVSPKGLLAALEAGWADGAILPGEVAVEAVDRRGLATPLVDLRRGEGPRAARALGFLSLQGTPEGLARRRETVERVVRAVVRAQRRLRQDPELAVQVAERVFADKDPQVVRAVVMLEAPGYRPAVSREAVSHLVAALRAAGRLPADVPYGQGVAVGFSALWSE